MKTFENKLGGGLDRCAAVFHSPKNGTVIANSAKYNALKNLKNELAARHEHMAAKNIIVDSMYGIDCVTVFSGTDCWLVLEEQPPMELTIIAQNPFCGSVISEAEKILRS